MKTRELAYSYLRFSHPDQSKGDTLRRQKDLRDAWLDRNKSVTLDMGPTLEDRGVSGYTGEHRDNADRHALAAFLALVKQGRITRGSYLIVESLDRLSREDIIPALSLLLDLIQSGVRVVQLLPVEVVYDDRSDPMHLMMAIMELSRGHSESVMKSERVGNAWQDKKRRAAENSEPLTARAPSWLRLVNGKWEVVESAAETIQRIFRMATEGYGIGAITKKLNAERVPIISRGKHWPRSYVAKLLFNRAVLGEYQPYTGRGPKRKPDGKPIPRYYPRIVSEQEWYAARDAMARRRGKVGRLGNEDGIVTHLNIFAGLLFDARDGGSIQRTSTGRETGDGERYLLRSYKALQGVKGSRLVSFPATTFEQAILSCLREIDPRDILPRTSAKQDKSVLLSGRLAEVEAEIEKVKARLQSRYSDAIADVLQRHESEQATLTQQLAEARQEAASPLGAAWGQMGTLLQALNDAPDPQDARVRLRAALRRTVERIWCLFVPRGMVRLAAVQVWFAGGKCRNYLIVHRAASGGFAGVRPSKWWVRSLTSDDVDVANLDLRQHKDAVALEHVLRDADLADMMDEV
jgi:DNA invertase Pin-like site-specific DNA recombinase